jgi:hypothetical protein
VGSRWSACVVALLGFFGGAGPIFAYDPGYPFNQYPAGGSKFSECSEDLPGSLYTAGPIEYSCRQTDLSHINGQTDKYRFTAIACGRSDTDRVAKHNASARAAQAMFTLKTDKAGQLGTDASRNEVFVNDATNTNCTRTAGGTAASDLSDSAPATFPSNQASLPPSQPQDTAQENAAREEARRTLVVDAKSLDEYIVHLNFHSQDRDIEWPGGDQIYTLKDSGFHTFRLSCTPGEKICYGAGRSGNYSIYWGAGIDGREGCEGCCMTCGGSYRYTLNGGSSDDGSGSSSSFGETLGVLTDILGGVAGAVGSGSGSAAAGSSAGSTPAYRPAPPGRNSDITGTRR